MKLRTMLAFIAGGLTFAWLLEKGYMMNTEHPREGSVVYEDDRIKVTRMSTKPSKNLDIATITYKEQTVEGAEEA